MAEPCWVVMAKRLVFQREDRLRSDPGGWSGIAGGGVAGDCECGRTVEALP